MKPHKLLSVVAVICALMLLPETASAQRGSGRHGGHGVRAGGRQVVIVGRPVVRDTIVRRAVVKPHGIVRRQPIVAGSVPAGRFGRIGFGTFPVRTGFGTVPVRTGFEVAPVGTGFVHAGTGFVHAGTGFVHTRRVPGQFVRGSRHGFASKGFREHNRGRFFRGGVVVGAPVYPYYPYYPYPYVYPEYGYPAAPGYYPPQTYGQPQTYGYGQPQTYGGDFGAGGVSAGLSTYFMELANQNQSGLTFDVSPATAEVFVDGAYVGIVQDFSAGRALTVAPGTHRIDLHVPGYSTVTFDVALTAGQVVPYQGELLPPGP